MFNKVLGGTLHGVEGRLITVEADVSDGLPSFNMVGFLASEVREASDRVRTSLKNSGFFLSPKKITINLSPADIRKEGSAFDLPIGVALLAAYGYIPEESVENTLLIGELSLNGELKGVRGILPIVDFAKKNGIDNVILPYDNRREAAVIRDIRIYGAKNLKEVCNHLTGDKYIEASKHTVMDKLQYDYNFDFSDIRGQEGMKRATEIAVAGMHNIIFAGPPGAGKSMIAKRIPTIMPDLSYDESVELTKIYSVKGMLGPDEGLIVNRPFRTPHHSITAQSLIGGGKLPKPGEISLAHHGVLFLDELLEFQKNTIEMLRQPMEDCVITISRMYGSYTFPCNFMLVAAMNPCPCGYFPDRAKCHCTQLQIDRYLRKLSRPMLDRMDMCLQVRRVKYEELCNIKIGEKSSDIKQRIEKVHNIQYERLKGCGLRFNSQIPSSLIDEMCMLDENMKIYIKDIFEQYQMTARGIGKILKVARTIADLNASKEVTKDHILEALSYRVNELWQEGDGI